jgi:cystathionine gamma-lyase
MKDTEGKGLSTRAIHAGQPADVATGAVMTPIYATSTYAQESPGVVKVSDYSRGTNPTRSAYQDCMADLEGGVAGFAFASGMAATATILDLLDSGDHVIASSDLYGGSGRLFEQVRARSAGLKFTLLDMRDVDAVRAAVRPETRMLWLETPSNPLLRLIDLEAMAEIAREHGLIAAADNTFASPYNTQPISYGFDIVMHSATKYINGHSDIIGGVAVVASEELAERMAFLHMSIGAIQGPFECFLAMRGLKTLGVRMERHAENAEEIASWLTTRDEVAEVIYPGLASHPQHELALRQMRTPGGMLSFRLDGDLAKTKRFMEKLDVFTLAESLGGVESLINHPAIMTHASVPPERREELGIGDNLVRLSVGIEDVEDLIADLETALEA